MPSTPYSTATLVAWGTAACVLGFLVVFSPARLEQLPPICVSQWLFDWECWGCGMVRAFSSLLRGQLAEAYHYNWRVFIVVPILAYAGVRPVLRARSGD